jgi:putative membrane protein
MNMLDRTKGFKKFISSFLGIASASVFISLPGLAQANLNSVNNSSRQYILAEGTPKPTPTGSSTFNPDSTNSDATLRTVDTEFMTKAAQSDLTEIQTSQLALQKSQNQSVRNYAQQMIDHHTASSEKLAAIAKAKNFTLPKDMGPEGEALLTTLKPLSGSNFDKAYIQGQIDAHQKTLADYQNYLQNGQDQDLRAFASEIAPLVAQHLDMALKMRAGK